MRIIICDDDITFADKLQKEIGSFFAQRSLALPEFVTYHTGEQLPPVRQLASKLTINPRTLEQAYMELEQEGYLYTIPGKGTYVAAQECVDSTRKSELMQKFDRLVIELSGLSVPAGELTRRVTDLTKET